MLAVSKSSAGVPPASIPAGETPALLSLPNRQPHRHLRVATIPPSVIRHELQRELALPTGIYLAIELRATPRPRLPRKRGHTNGQHIYIGHVVASLHKLQRLRTDADLEHNIRHADFGRQII